MFRRAWATLSPCPPDAPRASRGPKSAMPPLQSSPRSLMPRSSLVVARLHPPCARGDRVPCATVNVQARWEPTLTIASTARAEAPAVEQSAAAACSDAEHLTKLRSAVAAPLSSEARHQRRIMVGGDAEAGIARRDAELRDVVEEPRPAHIGRCQCSSAPSAAAGVAAGVRRGPPCGLLREGAQPSRTGRSRDGPAAVGLSHERETAGSTVSWSRRGALTAGDEAHTISSSSGLLGRGDETFADSADTATGRDALGPGSAARRLRTRRRVRCPAVDGRVARSAPSARTSRAATLE
jgi:hypothetical protein